PRRRARSGAGRRALGLGRRRSAASARAAHARPTRRSRPAAPRSRSRRAASALNGLFGGRRGLLPVELCDLAGQGAGTADVGGTLRPRQRAARVEQVQEVRALEHLVVGRERQAALDEVPTLLLVLAEPAGEDVDRRLFEVVDRPLALALLEDVPPGHAGRPLELERGPL